ncbi:unnamed protein product [Vitrella brassicaformis CCMP3155]|uniref:PAS domain-containing protein n=2 Tax=Vitrella brassicaformis TaxID=1169539 RepID=A0A0G4E909_VITBC|nr:unnamed protein product [Vitrella brassicaformis CCMP3155]|eukprot:CEL91880.1 unnamed protein product [Vitrella brassicaformis CCMP3155]
MEEEFVLWQVFEGLAFYRLCLWVTLVACAIGFFRQAAQTAFRFWDIHNLVWLACSAGRCCFQWWVARSVSLCMKTQDAASLRIIRRVLLLMVVFAALNQVVGANDLVRRFVNMYSFSTPMGVSFPVATSLLVLSAPGLFFLERIFLFTCATALHMVLGLLMLHGSPTTDYGVGGAAGYSLVTLVSLLFAPTVFYSWFHHERLQRIVWEKQSSSQSHLRQLSDVTNDLVCEVDDQGHILYASPNFESVLGPSGGAGGTKTGERDGLVTKEGPLRSTDGESSSYIGTRLVDLILEEDRHLYEGCFRNADCKEDTGSDSTHDGTSETLSNTSRSPSCNTPQPPGVSGASSSFSFNSHLGQRLTKDTCSAGPRTVFSRVSSAEEGGGRWRCCILRLKRQRDGHEEPSYLSCELYVAAQLADSQSSSRRFICAMRDVTEVQRTMAKLSSLLEGCAQQMDLSIWGMDTRTMKAVETQHRTCGGLHTQQHQPASSTQSTCCQQPVPQQQQQQDQPSPPPESLVPQAGDADGGSCYSSSDSRAHTTDPHSTDSTSTSHHLSSQDNSHGNGLAIHRLTTDDIKACGKAPVRLASSGVSGSFSPTCSPTDPAWMQSLKEPEREKMEAAMRDLLEGGKSFQQEVQYEQADGAIKWLKVAGRLANGVPDLVWGFVMDITVERLRESETGSRAEKLQWLADASFDGWGVAEVMDSKLILESSPRLNILYGASLEGCRVETILPVDVLQTIMQRGSCKDVLITIHPQKFVARPPQYVFCSAVQDPLDPAMVLFALRDAPYIEQPPTDPPTDNTDDHPGDLCRSSFTGLCESHIPQHKSSFPPQYCAARDCYNGDDESSVSVSVNRPAYEMAVRRAMEWSSDGPACPPPPSRAPCEAMASNGEGKREAESIWEAESESVDDEYQLLKQQVLSSLPRGASPRANETEPHPPMSMKSNMRREAPPTTGTEDGLRRRVRPRSDASLDAHSVPSSTKSDDGPVARPDHTAPLTTRTRIVRPSSPPLSAPSELRADDDDAHGKDDGGSKGSGGNGNGSSQWGQRGAVVTQRRRVSHSWAGGGSTMQRRLPPIQEEDTHHQNHHQQHSAAPDREER